MGGGSIRPPPLQVRGLSVYRCCQGRPSIGTSSVRPHDDISTLTRHQYIDTSSVYQYVISTSARHQYISTTPSVNRQVVILRVVGLEVGDAVHLLPGHLVGVDHVPAPVVVGGERLLADGTRRLARVLLHVLGEAATVGVGGAAHRARTGP